MGKFVNKSMIHTTNLYYIIIKIQPYGNKQDIKIIENYASVKI